MINQYLQIESTYLKFFKKIIELRIVGDLKKINVLSENQFGLIERRLTQEAITINTVCYPEFAENFLNILGFEEYYTECVRGECLEFY